MKKIIINIIAVIMGLVIGSVVNMALVMVGPIVVPPPEGVDMTDMESLSQTIHLLGPQHFIFPLLAHALGTLVGAVAAYYIAASQKIIMAYVIGVLFLLGGIVAATMIPAATWFIVLDLTVSYIPMAWLATVIARRLKKI